ncbi:hypothetical protein K503DRAFT_437982 [Rhizopogon vinicolor AM-OR11-026]|uniref:Uncharacterized protein n=1 Tax=Rhizopogon vinicolor AM-OR11-026 TaxID=1314800 RepID=A0A1B7NAT2_9AGAM|nr:hypothetical protein K503DRAFT_437982 [Rhizopogon vinicolor AM-OR11-026]
MPPKRKRADAESQGAPVRSTRSSTRTGTNGTATLDCAAASVAEGVEATPPPKKSRNTAIKATSRAKTSAKGRASTAKASSNADVSHANDPFPNTNYIIHSPSRQRAGTYLLDQACIERRRSR